MDIGPFCNDGDCEVHAFIDYLRERMVKGEVSQICLGQTPKSNGSFSLLFIILLAVAFLLVNFAVGYCLFC